MDFAPTKFDESGNPYHGTDKNLFVEFYKLKELKTKAPVNQAQPTLAIDEVEALTNEKGEFQYNEIPMIRIFSPGNKTTVVERRVKIHGDHISPSDPDRFPLQWSQFQKGEQQKGSGHLLSEMGLGDKEIRVFNENNVFTVESLINVPDGLLPEIILGARSIRDKAKIWLDKKLSEKNCLEEQKTILTEQSTKIAALEQQIETLLQAQKPSKKE